MNLSLKNKLLLFSATMILILAIVAISFRERQRSNAEETLKTVERSGHENVFQDLLVSETPTLKKALDGYLMSEDVIAFLENPKNEHARLNVLGLILFYTKNGICRATIYDRQYDNVLEQTDQSKDVKNTDSPLPKSIVTLAKESAKDLVSKTYLRVSTPKAGGPESVEYCIIAPVIDDNDALIGFVEVSICLKEQIARLAKVLNAQVAIQSATSFQSIGKDSNPEITPPLLDRYGKEVEDGIVVYPLQDHYYRCDRIRLKGQQGETLGYLWIVRDKTEYENQLKRDNILFYSVFLGVLIAMIAFMAYFLSKKTTLILKACEEVLDGANDVASIAKEFSNTSKTIAVGTAQEASSAENISQTAKLLSVKAKGGRDLANNAQSMSSLAVEKVQGTQQFLRRIKESIACVGSTVDQVVLEGDKELHVVEVAMKLIQSVNSDVVGLNHSFVQISNIVEAIIRIAGKTNLLALNAGIEAAKAGEHGKGFSVVAQEVKQLAKSSAETAASINLQITKMNQESSAVMTALEEVQKIMDTVQTSSSSIRTSIQNEAASEFTVVGQLEKLVALAESSESYLNEMLVSNETVLEKVHAMSQLSGEQQRQTDVIDRVLDDIGKLIHNNASSAEEMTISADSLANQATHFRKSAILLKELVAGNTGKSGNNPES